MKEQVNKRKCLDLTFWRFISVAMFLDITGMFQIPRILRDLNWLIFSDRLKVCLNQAKLIP